MFENEFKAIEAKWSKSWRDMGLFNVRTDLLKPKYYCLDMFPYPSGAGLHVGHPRGYIATDIHSRFMRMQGFNVLHPLGFDSFGLPAEQFAVETGQHPALTTEQNIKTFKSQLEKLGLSHDAEREIITSDAQYYQWTQWIFLRLFNSWYDRNEDKARPISELVSFLEINGAIGLNAACTVDFELLTPSTWCDFDRVQKEAFLMNFRLAYKAEVEVNWCDQLGTVLANDEVVNGVSERGGHPVTGKKMDQWMLRVTAYADRLLANLENLDWPDSVKAIQRNWIGKVGFFAIDGKADQPPEIEPLEIGLSKLAMPKFKLRDAVFGRQRYWGEPIPIYYDEDGVAVGLEEAELPLKLPKVTTFVPTTQGSAPLARLDNWLHGGRPIETTTMPGWAASSWYFLRYTDPKNDLYFARAEDVNYWGAVDLYMGGAEHATGHLIYSRFYSNFLYDCGLISFCEPFTRLVCQGMILGVSAIIYREVLSGKLVSAAFVHGRDIQSVHIDIKLVSDDNSVDIEGLRVWRSDFSTVEMELEDGKLFCVRVTEKMSKSKHNVINPDDIIGQYGADCFRLHVMFLGPIDQATLWSTKTIQGPYKFLGRVWRLFYDDMDNLIVSRELPDRQSLVIINQAIERVKEKTSSFAFNSAIASIMSCVGELTKLKIKHYCVLEKLLIILHPYAPFITSELWSRALGRTTSILNCSYPEVFDIGISGSGYTLVVAVNGKPRFTVDVGSDYSGGEAGLRALATAHADAFKWISTASIEKTIYVPGKLINFVLKV